MSSNIEEYYVTDSYRDFYDHVSLTQDIAQRLRSFENYKSYHYKDLHYVKQIVKTRAIDTVLDIGCCGSPYPTLFDLSKVEFFGVDISSISLKRMSEIYPDERINWVLDDASILGHIENDAFDLIIATQVFEHLPNPGLAFENIWKKLRVGGRFLIGTESALFVNPDSVPKYLGTLSEMFMFLGYPYLLYGQEPVFHLNTQNHTYKSSSKKPVEIEIPHGHFHPLFFDYRIKTKTLPLKLIMKRVTGGILLDTFFSAMGASMLFNWYELKSRLPVVRNLGSQVLVVYERTS